MSHGVNNVHYYSLFADIYRLLITKQ